MERELPEINVGGTVFLVDVKEVRLKEKDNPKNAISVFDMLERENGYFFNYSLSEKNIPGMSNREWSDLIYVNLPPLVDLDPVGMALKYNVPLESIKNKTDFDVMVDQVAFDLRVNKGQLPTVDIAGHIFYVDLRMDMLRPKDDFLSKGIVFDEIEAYYFEEDKLYYIPYNPKKHEFQYIDDEKITSLPKGVIAVQFPYKTELDPIGWNRLSGLDLKYGLKEIGPKPHFVAKTTPLEKTYLPVIIKENLKNQKKLKADAGIKNTKPQNKIKGKGRGI